MSEQRFMYDSLQDAESIRDFLRALTDGFEKGEISLSSNGESLTLHPHGLLNFTVKAKQKRGLSKIRIRISWKDSREDQGGSDAPLRIE